MPVRLQIVGRLTAAAAVLFVAACGGGGGGGMPAPPATLSVSPSSLTFLANGPSDSTPAAQTVIGTVTGVSSGTLYITIVGSGPAIGAISTVTITSNSSGQSSVSVPAPATLGIGTYTGTISVTACLNDPQCATGKLSGSPQTVNVTYNVAGLKTSAASLGYTVTNTPQPTDLTSQFTVTTFPAQNWSATAASSWLSVTASGASGDVLTASLVQSALDVLDDGTYSSTIHLVPATSGQPLDIPVSVTVKRTQVDYVSPYVAYLGTSGNVIIRGQEFSQLTGASAIQNVLFGSTPAQSYTVVSSTEIDATYPATLAVGRYPVVLQSSFTATHQLADLVVVAPPTFAAAVLAYPDSNSKQPMALVYDAERQALGATVWYGTGATSTLRYASTGGSWQSPTVMPINNTFTLAMAADGADWIAGAYRDVANLDPVSLAVLATPASPINGGSPEIVFDTAVASDGTVAVTTSFLGGGCTSTLMYYNVRKQSYTLPPYTPCRARVGASADGSRLLVIDQDSSFSGGGVYLANTAAGTLTATGLQALSSFEPVLDRTGDRIALSLDQSITPHWEIFDGNYTDLGSLPTTTLVVILSPDGHKAYTFDQSGLLRTFDLTATPVAGVFPEIGTGITLAGSPGVSVPSGTGLGSNSQPLRMAMTPDGATVFIAGTDALIVQPVP